MPPKGKPDTAGYQRFKKELAAGTPGKLYLLHGEETYLRDHYLGKLRSLLLTGGMGTFNLHEIPAREMSPRRLEEALDCLPMMAERTLVLVTDFDLFKAGEKDREEYIRLLGDLPDYVCLVFVYDLIPYKGDARTKLAGAIRQNGVVVNFARQDQGDLVDWVRRRFRALGKDIDSRLALDLIFLCGDLMTNLIGEIEKVGAYAKGQRITRGDIDAVATPQLDAVVFRMTDAIGEGKFDRAAAVLGELYQMQEPPIRIMWSLGRQMRQLYSARLAIEKGKGAPYVAGLWGLKPYPADKLMTSARRFSLSWCRRAVVRCGQTDLAMKSTGQDAQELLTGLLLELAAPSRPAGRQGAGAGIMRPNRPEPRRARSPVTRTPIDIVRDKLARRARLRADTGPRFREAPAGSVPGAGPGPPGGGGRGGGRPPGPPRPGRAPSAGASPARSPASSTAGGRGCSKRCTRGPSPSRRRATRRAAPSATTCGTRWARRCGASPSPPSPWWPPSSPAPRARACSPWRSWWARC